MRLLRPHIPLETRCRVVLRQIGEMWPDRVISDHRSMSGGLGRLLSSRLALLVEFLRCESLHLDHDPALGAREKVIRKGVHVGYKPDANDPEFLFYREKRSHQVKTNIRGDHGQHPDRVLIKKARRLERKKALPKRKLIKGPKRQLKTASKWPKGRKIMGRSSWPTTRKSNGRMRAGIRSGRKT